MKQFTALLLVLALCLGLSACASEDEKAFEAANALLDAGDYEGALDAYYSIGLYQQINEKIAEAESLSIGGRVAPYVGIWKDLKSNAILTLNPDGTFVCTEESFTLDGLAMVEEGTIFLHTALTPQQIDGVSHLTDSYQDFVPEADYESLCANLVEITMENWEQYFELREATQVHTNEFDEITNVSYGYAVCLREEYKDRLFNEHDAVDVAFKLGYDNETCVVEGDYPTDYTLGEAKKISWYPYEHSESSGSVYLHSYEGEHLSSYFNEYAAVITSGSWTEEMGRTYIERFVNCEVVNVTGTLYLYP